MGNLHNFLAITGILCDNNVKTGRNSIVIALPVEWNSLKVSALSSALGIFYIFSA